jgi:phenylalanyl-tRNA synthetase beta chain
MRIPVDWLKEYVPNELSVRELAFILTNVGLEVEAIEEGEGTAERRHPPMNADEHESAACGGNGNGATAEPGRHEGTKGNGNGPAAETAVFEIKVTPNRGDCLSVVGVARELAMKLRRPLADREPGISETGPAAESLVKVTLDDPALCPRYSARVVRGVKIGPSPEWAQRRLELCGLRPINNVVDATNLVMVELGQPLHAFDYRLVKGGLKPIRRAQGRPAVPEIIVRRARAGERLVTIDGEEREVTPEILLIADPGGPIALAGIMGGSSTEIHDGTTEVLLESAHFDPLTIRRGARALGMSTEASYRFERTVDPGGTVRALDRACELIVEFCESPVEIARGVVDAYPNPVQEREIALRPGRVNALLGLDLTPQQIAEHLRWLKLEVRAGLGSSGKSDLSEGGRGNLLSVRVPTFRQDLVAEIDLVEEVARVHGYEDIAETLPGGSAGVGGLPPELAFEREVRHLLRGMGLSETVTSSLESGQGHERLKLPPDHPLRRAVVISNWKTADRTQLRTTLLTSLLEVVALNRRQGVAEVSIFDLGRVYLPDAAGRLPDQPQRLGIAVTGVMTAGRWAVPPALARWDFYALKGVVENLVEAVTRKAAEFAPEEQPLDSAPFDYAQGKQGRPWLQPGRGARVSAGGALIGSLGELRSEVREEYDLPDPVFVGELDLEALRGQAADGPSYRPVSRFPAVTRDVAFLVPRDVPAERARRVIEEAAGDEVESVRLFDAFEGRPLPVGVRNLAYSLAFRRPDRTMTDEEVEARMARIRASLRERLGAQIRE